MRVRRRAAAPTAPEGSSAAAPTPPGSRSRHVTPRYLAPLEPAAECLPDEQEADREAAVAAAGEQRLSELLLSSLVSSPPEREPLPRNLLQTVRIPFLFPGLPLLALA